MKKLDVQTAINEMAKGQIRPVYLCYGSEIYLIEQFLSIITRHVAEDPEVQQWAVSRHNLTETTIETVIEDAQTLPFLVPRKLIIVREAYLFTAAKDGQKADEQDTRRLLEYLEAPADFSVLVFVVHGEKLDERKKIVKRLREHFAVLSFNPMPERDLRQWIHRQAEQRKFSLDEEAVDMLMMYTGSQLQALAGEMEKLSLYVGSGGKASAEDVKQIVAKTTEQNVFMLIDDAVRQRLSNALDRLNELIRQREEPIKILMLMARQFRNMLESKQLSMQGYSQSQIAQQLGLHPYAVKMALEQAKSYELKTLGKILSRIAELDYRIKSGRTDKSLALELFLMELCENGP